MEGDENYISSSPRWWIDYLNAMWSRYGTQLRFSLRFKKQNMQAPIATLSTYAALMDALCSLKATFRLHDDHDVRPCHWHWQCAVRLGVAGGTILSNYSNFFPLQPECLTSGLGIKISRLTYYIYHLRVIP